MATVQKLSPRSQRSWDAFRERVTELGGEVLGEWKNTTTHVLLRCSAGHECSPRPNCVLRGSGICRTCAGKDPQAAWAAFQRRLEWLGATLLEPAWLGVEKPHRAKCPVGHECAPRPNDVRNGRGICRACVGRDPEVAEEAFRARVAEWGGEVLEPRWRGVGMPHRVRCAKGHEHSPRPGNVMRSTNICRTCIGQDSQAAWSRFRANIEELGGEVVEQRWLGAGAPHRVRCSLGHECNPRPNDVKKGQGICLLCKGRKWDVFYVVGDDINGVVKFGITSGNSQRRLDFHARNGFDRTVRLRENLPGDEALRLERAVIAALRDAREEPIRGREYFPMHALGLILDVVDGWIASLASRGAFEATAIRAAA